jgi:hypothetical protein
MEIQGLTPIDTLYEFMGYTISLRLGKYLLWNGYILGFLLAAAVVRLYYVGSREGSFKDLAVYPLYVLFMLFLIWPIDVALTAPRSQSSGFLEETNPENGMFWDPAEGTGGGQVRPDTLKVPRILAYVSALVGSLQKNLVSDICDDMHTAMYQWKHVAAINTNARFFDRSLREDLGVYLKCCYYPALTTDKNRDPDPWKIVPFAGLPIDSWLTAAYQQMDLRAEETHYRDYFGEAPTPCTGLHQTLNSAITSELWGATFHTKALAAYGRLANQKGGGQASAAEYAKFYRRRLIYNEIFVIGGSTAATLRAALPEYSVFKDGNMDLKYITTDSQDKGTLMNVFTAITKLPAALAAVASSVSEGWSQKAMGPATYYRVSALGPYIYGLLLAILVIVFPLAGLLSIWPQWWTAIINFMKLFLSIKLWPIFWAFLSGMMSYKEAFTPEDPEGFQGTFGSEGMLPALAVMYLIVPVFSFMITSIAQHAGGAMLGSLIGQGQEASLAGTMGAITQPSSMAARLADSGHEGRSRGS